MDEDTTLNSCIIHYEGSSREHFTSLNKERFERIKSVEYRRLQMPISSPYRMDNICCNIPKEVPTFEGYGYHRDCYQRFTANLHLLEDSVSEEAVEPETKRRKRESHGNQVGDIVIIRCIFSQGDSQIANRYSLIQLFGGS